MQEEHSERKFRVLLSKRSDENPKFWEFQNPETFEERLKQQNVKDKTLQEVFEKYQEFLDRTKSETSKISSKISNFSQDDADLRLAQLGFCERFELSDSFGIPNKKEYYSNKFCISE